jgi:hypothetical protein
VASYLFQEVSLLRKHTPLCSAALLPLSLWRRSMGFASPPHDGFALIAAAPLRRRDAADYLTYAIK